MHIGCLVDYLAVLLYFELDGIQEDYGVYLLQRPVLPLWVFLLF